MINKDRIVKVEIYDKNKKMLFLTDAFTFPKDFFKVKGWELVSIKQANLPLLRKDDNVSVVFEYRDGTRVKCDTKVDISTPDQLNFRVDDGYILEERRNSFKVNTPNEYVKVTDVVYGNETSASFNEPLTVRLHNINLTGILLGNSIQLKAKDIVYLRLFEEEMAMRAEVLRIQKDSNGNIIGYGCRFLDVAPAEEERIARFIFNLQLQERERRNNKD